MARALWSGTLSFGLVSIRVEVRRAVRDNRPRFRTKRIEVLDFVKADQIDDRFFDKPYYLTPGKGGDAAYALLREAIRASARIGIAKFILRDTQQPLIAASQP